MKNKEKLDLQTEDSKDIVRAKGVRKPTSELGISPSYVSRIVSGERPLTPRVLTKIGLVNTSTALVNTFVDKKGQNLYLGKGGLEPPRITPHDPKSCSSASSDTSPSKLFYSWKRPKINYSKVFH